MLIFISSKTHRFSAKIAVNLVTIKNVAYFEPLSNDLDSSNFSESILESVTSDDS